jgi:hypothetical protein
MLRRPRFDKPGCQNRQASPDSAAAAYQNGSEEQIRRPRHVRRIGSPRIARSPERLPSTRAVSTRLKRRTSAAHSQRDPFFRRPKPKRHSQLPSNRLGVQIPQSRVYPGWDMGTPKHVNAGMRILKSESKLSQSKGRAEVARTNSGMNRDLHPTEIGRAR